MTLCGGEGQRKVIWSRLLPGMHHLPRNWRLALVSLVLRVQGSTFTFLPAVWLAGVYDCGRWWERGGHVDSGLLPEQRRESLGTEEWADGLRHYGNHNSLIVCHHQHWRRSRLNWTLHSKALFMLRLASVAINNGIQETSLIADPVGGKISPGAPLSHKQQHISQIK